MTTPIDALLDKIPWKETGAAEPTDGIPVATHEGELFFCGKRLRCYQLSNGKRVFNTDDINAVLEMLDG